MTKLLSRESLFMLIIGLGAGLAFGNLVWSPSATANDQETQVRAGENVYTNPLLECEVAHGSIDAQKLNFSPQLEQRVNQLIREHKLNSVGVYFRDLNNGPTFGVNANEGYLPASLLKLPVAITLYKMNEEEYPGILDETIEYKKFFQPPQEGDKQYIRPSDEIKVGGHYTVRELIRRSLVYSDNQAISLLYEKINNTNPNELRKFYRLLGVDDTVLNGPLGTVSVKQYSSFFRVLYNASYVSVKGSEEILSLLANAEYHDGLVRGVPLDIKVAHKFGESGFEDGERQFHDCGIVYYPKHPYLLCVMSRGAKLETLSASIAKLSEFVYAQVDTQNKENVSGK